ncbi:serine/threonine protein kinase [Terriglobus saanensis]|uniref:Serine/threonine protein kinase n=1 Tax=Terriglobus saanensis (strain ATCC BAA-1853 / DSM 23119 / SP1PR4) TaxID=401053 RepID=E8V3E6_TERSS|nr:serine/threonine-protein kinase [Terriglobus saanensis]ADV83559.1 serine/threonine protein kinase [Terriglobus saanensis SP1PR4]
MMDARWKTIEQIFFEATERPKKDQEDFVRLAAAGDESLILEVLSLLRAEADADSVLDATVRHQFDDWFASEGSSASTSTGTRLGPYLLLRELNSGGMGTVHLAQRVDDQYSQIVAIKTVRAGYATPEVSRRFREERQILATLNHPNVGTILDGGETLEGHPFLVMEYVEGQAITTYCMEHKLSTPERLDLFSAVCGAVYHAHQKLILHRDIKPENVLVSKDGHPKLIDFGIAKTLGPSVSSGAGEANPKTLLWLTPSYASPEQFQSKPLSVASDIYSLGVLLYELLTDVRPYDLERLTPAEAERTVLQETVRKPSAVVAATRLKRELSGDLDRIVLMAMEKAPERRYKSVQHLTEDLQRFLEGRPVLARKATFLYVLRKACIRHKGTLVSIFLCIAMLAASYAGYRWRSRAAEARVQEISSLAQSTIGSMAENAQQSGSSTEVRAAISRRALAYLNQLEITMGSDPRLLLAMSSLHIRVGDIEGLPSVSNLGRTDEAIKSYQSALQFAEKADARLHSAESTAALVEALLHIAYIQTFEKDVEGATKTYARALSLAYPYWRQDPSSTQRERTLTMVYSGMGDAAMWRLEPNIAFTDFEMGFKVLGGQPNGKLDHDLLLADLHLRTADALNDFGRYKESLEETQTAASIASELSQAFPSSRARGTLLFSYRTMVNTLAGRDFINIGDSQQAKVYAEKTLALSKLLDSHDSKDIQSSFTTISALSAMADAERQNNPANAALWYQRALSLTKTLQPAYGAELQHRISILDEALAEVLPDAQRAEQMNLLKDNARIRAEQANFSSHGLIHLMGAYCRLADVELEAHNLTEATRYAEDASPLLQQYDRNSPSLLVLRNVSLCLRTQGDVHLSKAREIAGSGTARTSEVQAAIYSYEQSSQIWRKWQQRGAASPESTREARRVEIRLHQAQALLKRSS